MLGSKKSFPIVAGDGAVVVILAASVCFGCGTNSNQMSQTTDGNESQTQEENVTGEQSQSDKDTSSESQTSVLEEYAASLSYLDGNADGWKGYLYNSKGWLDYYIKEDDPGSAFSYRICDFDGDGADELLVASIMRKDFDPQYHDKGRDHYVQLDMYEEDGGKAVLRDSVSEATFIEQFGPDTIDCGLDSTDAKSRFFSYTYQNKMFFGTETSEWAGYVADGGGNAIALFTYDGNKIATEYANAMYGSDFDMEPESMAEYDEIKTKLGQYGLRVSDDILDIWYNVEKLYTDCLPEEATYGMINSVVNKDSADRLYQVYDDSGSLDDYYFTDISFFTGNHEANVTIE